jgi:para-aminobenzoate synthetase component 1
MKSVAILAAPAWRDPVAVLSPFADETFACLLHSGGGGWSYLLRGPAETLGEGDPLAALTALIGPAAANDPQGPPFQGGVVALASYELADHIEPAAMPRTAWPDLAAARYDALLAFDGATKRVFAIGRGGNPAAAQARASWALSWLDAPQGGGGPNRLAASFAPEPGEIYEAAVAQVVARIAAGEIFQANIARRWTGALRPGVTPYNLFARLCADSPAPFAAYLRLEGRALVSNSPERFIQIADGQVRAEPIKGTRPRGGDPAADADMAAQLKASPKDRAENLMIVDLMRNDLSRICTPGSVAAPALCELKTFANVHHLVSVVTGQLQPDVGAAQVLAATFPPGSITGAPKVQAMKVIAELEAPRGPFYGGLFWIASDGGLDSSVLIRTVACISAPDGWIIEARAGGGIVADSDPADERRETEAKIAAIARALLEPAA